MKFYAYTDYEIQYTCVINNIKNLAYLKKEKFCNINIRMCMKLNFIC